ncbi:MAG: hypothetical protein WDN00_04585 [Limisphaerales bacterium]
MQAEERLHQLQKQRDAKAAAKQAAKDKKTWHHYQYERTVNVLIADEWHHRLPDQ